MDLGLGLLNLFVPFPSVTVLTRSLYFLLLAISEALLIVLLGTGGWTWLARTAEQGPGSNNSGDTNTISKICRLFILKPFDLQKTYKDVPYTLHKIPLKSKNLCNQAILKDLENFWYQIGSEGKRLEFRHRHVSCLPSLPPWLFSTFAGHCDSLRVPRGFTVNRKCNLPSTSVGFTILDFTIGHGLKIFFKSYRFFSCHCPLIRQHNYEYKILLGTNNLDMI